MFSAPLVVYTLVSAFQNGPDAFNAIGGHIVPNPFAALVADSFVLVPFTQIVVATVFIREDEGIFFNSEKDIRFERLSAIRVNGADDDTTTSLAEAEHELFPLNPIFPQLFVEVFVLLQPADVSLVDFDFAFEKLEIGLHGLSKSVHHKPGRRLCNAQVTGQLGAADAFAGVVEHVHCIYPFAEWDIGVFKDGTSTHGELLLAAGAVVGVSVFDAGSYVPTAARALYAVRPAFGFEVVDSGLFAGEFFEECEGIEVAFVVAIDGGCSGGHAVYSGWKYGNYIHSKADFFV